MRFAKDLNNALASLKYDDHIGKGKTPLASWNYPQLCPQPVDYAVSKVLSGPFLVKDDQAKWAGA